MASMEVLESILPDDAFEDSIKCKKKKKKSKKEKKAKLEKKKRQKGQQYLKDDVESVTFTQIPKIKKKKKKKNDIRLQKEIPLLLTQPKRPSLFKRHKKPKDISQAVHNSTVQLDEQEPKKATLDESSTQQEHVRHKRRVMFNLSPEKILPKSHPFTCRHTLETQPSSADTLPSPHTLPSGSHSQPLVKENAQESQSTPEDINSQDLFITQKSFSEPYADISSTPSSDDMAAVPPYQKSKESMMSSQERPSCKQLAEASTQTENFFTFPRLATSLSFRHQSTASTFVGEPMDLSLPNRSRLEVGLRGWSGKPTKDQNRPELKTTDMTSSDESDILTKTKADFAHLKVVQTRLNESFFFKVKGERESPRPRSPLMFLTGGFDKKSKK